MKKNVKQQNDHNNPRQLTELKKNDHNRTQPRTEKSETHSTTKDNVKQTTEHKIPSVSLVRTFSNAMIMTFRLGPREKCLFLAFGIGPSAENVGKSQGKCKKRCVRKNDRFRTFFGVHGWPYRAKMESVFRQCSLCLLCFLYLLTTFLTMFSACFIVRSCPFFRFFTTNIAPHNRQHTIPTTQRSTPQQQHHHSKTSQHTAAFPSSVVFSIIHD